MAKIWSAVTCRQSRAAFSGLAEKQSAPLMLDGDKSPAESADKSTHSKACGGDFLWITLLVVISLLSHFQQSCHAHGVDLPKLTAEQLAAVPPTMSNSVVFAQELLTHCRNKLSAPQLEVLDRIRDALAVGEQIRFGHVPDAGARDGEYYRWQGETNLLGLLAQTPEVIALDFRPGQTATPPVTTFELDQQFNLLLLKVVTGGGPPRFVVHELDMTSERDPLRYTATIGSNCTTYILVKLAQVPSDKTIFLLGFRFENENAAAFHHPISFVSRPHGQLSVEVLDEHGQSVPVLMRLTSGTGQRLWEPAGALDFAPMMNDVTAMPIYGPGRGYMVWIPGNFRGHYWVVPKPFEMSVPAGSWEIHILRGIETIPVHETFRVEAGAWTRKTIRLKRWINQPARGWFSGDDHIHSRLMSSEDGEKLLALARAADIHVSNILEMGNEMRTWYAQRGFGPEFRVREGNHWLVPGQEDPRSMLGHAIGLNLRSKVRDLNRYYLNDWVAEEIHKQGGLYGHTHVGEKALGVEREMALFTPMDIVDFNSILQIRLGTELFYDFLNLGFKMTASAGTDTPYGGVVGNVRLYAYCGTNQPFTPDLWFDAMKRGRTFVTSGSMLDFTIEGARPGDEISVTNNRPLAVKIRAEGLRGGSAPVRLQLIQFGKVIHEVTAARDDQDSLELSVTVPAGYGGWLAAHAIGRDGSEAHTTPIYITRPGFRFWDTTKAEALIAKQLTVLDDTEKAIREAETVMRTGNQSHNYFHRWPAEQSEQLRERMTKTREFYLHLRATLETERKSRQ